MGFFWSNKKKKDPTPDPTQGLTLQAMQPGYYVDYDLNTWEVTSIGSYDWGAGEISHEWQLKAASDLIYLERVIGDEDEWSISRKLPTSKIDDSVFDLLRKDEDPPDEITVDGTVFYLESSGSGLYHENRQGVGQPMLSWDYEDDDGEKYLTIEQWGENCFEASMGEEAEEYQFTNILPGITD